MEAASNETELIRALGDLGIGGLILILGAFLLYTYLKHGREVKVSDATASQALDVVSANQQTLAEILILSRTSAAHAEGCATTHAAQAQLLATIIGNQNRILDQLLGPGRRPRDYG